MTDFYSKVYEEIQNYDVCCCYNVLGVRSGFYTTYPDWMKKEMLLSNHLGHSHDKRFPGLLCTEFTADNEVNCYYLFGETILIGHHKVGQCPWKLL